jgi:hypothetical protein
LEMKNEKVGEKNVALMVCKPCPVAAFQPHCLVFGSRGDSMTVGRKCHGQYRVVNGAFRRGDGIVMGTMC